MNTFTAHNIYLNNNILTKPEANYLLTDTKQFKSFVQILDLKYHGLDKSKIKILDVGCLEGGYTAEFAKLGYNSTGIEVRESNFKNCMYIKENLDLPNLNFIHDDFRNLDKYGNFNVFFCCGLLYHLDHPHRLLTQISLQCEDMLILHTHYSRPEVKEQIFPLEELCVHEGLPGQWYIEFNDNEKINQQEEFKWSSWNNYKSFWPTKPALINSLEKIGFKTVFENYDWIEEDLQESLESAFYKTQQRTLLVGIK